jgi:HK97 family phage portal protein
MLNLIQRAIQTAADNRKASPLASVLQRGGKVMTGIYGPTYPTTDYTDLVNNGYKRNPDVYAAVSLIARACAAVPWYLSQVDNEGSDVEYRNPELARKIANPAPNVTFSYWMRQAVTDYLLGGNYYSYLIEAGGRIYEWQRMRPDYVSIIPSSDLSRPVAKYLYSYGVTREIEPEYVTHWRNFDPVNDWYGMSPLEAAIRSVTMGNSAIDWNTATLQNMGRFSGIIKFADTLDEAQKEAIYSAFQDRRAGAANAGKPLLTDDEFEWVPTSMNVVDADWFNGLNLTKQQIASVFGIDSVLIGDKTASTYNNQEQAMLRLYYDVVMPILLEISGWLSESVISTWQANAVLRFDFEGIDAIKRDQAAAYERLEKVSFLSPNEKRTEVGYEVRPEPAMDAIYVNSGVIPITETSLDLNADV